MSVFKMPIQDVISSLPNVVPVVPSLEEENNWRVWRAWIFSNLVIVIIFLSVMDVAPYLQMDEFIIVDLGRVIINSDTDWSLNWLATKNQPAWVWFYIGPVMQELSYRLFGDIGPRISGLFGAILAATTVVGWLLSRGTTKYAAYILGLIFLLDPIFVQSYTRGRVDGWAITLSLGACWLIRCSLNNLANVKVNISIAGALAAMALFIWPSAAFLLPLIVLELFYVALKNLHRLEIWRGFGIIIILFGASGLVTVVVVLLPVYEKLFYHFNNILEGMAVNTRFGAAEMKHSTFYFVFTPVIELARSLRFTLALTILALVSLYIRREIGLILAGLAAFALMYFTIVYTYRVLYLLPYLVALVAGINQVNIKREYTHAANLIRRGGLLLLLVWSIVFSLIVRMSFASELRHSQDKAKLKQIAISVIGKGNHKVLLPHEFYYTGRSLGWKLYSSYRAVGETLSSDTLRRLLANSEYAIVLDWQVTEEFSEQLKKANMNLVGTYDAFEGQKEAFDGKTTNEVRLRNLYSIYRQPYGTYKIYKRENITHRKL